MKALIVAIRKIAAAAAIRRAEAQKLSVVRLLQRRQHGWRRHELQVFHHV